jgi:signal transduction histidine kinase
VRFIIPRLRLVLIIAVTLSTVCIISLVSWFFTIQYQKEAMTHLHHYATTVAADVASAEADFIITENYASLQDSILSFQQRTHVQSIAIITPDGTIIADTQPEHLGSLFHIDGKSIPQSKREYTHVDFESCLAETLRPIQVGESLIGWCNILLDIGYIQNGVVNIQKKIILMTIFAVLIISVLLLLLSAVITQPLEEIMAAAVKVAEGDFDRKAKIAGVLEIRKLAEVFNIMTQAVKEREIRLRQAQKMEAIGTLSASIAHEFGNPLVGISFLLGDLKKNDCLGVEEQRLLTLGQEECAHMKTLIRDLKCFYRPSSEQKTPVDLHQLIDNIFLFQKSYLQSRNIVVIRKYDENVPAVMAVEDQIKQVLMNLLLNAAESMDKNGGVVTISTACDSEIVRITVKDTGTGISREDLDNIFMPFFSTKPDVSGTGLGLSVSYGIVKSHQGDIQVSSTPDKGTTFILTLPIGWGD